MESSDRFRTSFRSIVERDLLELWTGLLGVTDIDIESSFLDLGGDSLFLVHLAEYIQRTYGVRLALATFFDLRTVALVAREIESMVGPAYLRAPFRTTDLK